MISEEEMLSLPGGDLVVKGLSDLKKGEVTENSLLLLIAAPRLVRLGFDIVGDLRLEDNKSKDLELKLYLLIKDNYKSSSAHSYYNSLIRKIVSFSKALEGFKKF